MVFVDGETWPPSIHGTGTEEIFGGGACPVGVRRPVSRLPSDRVAGLRGLVGAYRWFVQDPIRFTRSLRWTVEHGHANNFANEYASVAYWYQTEPHAPFPPLPARDALRPPFPAAYEEARTAFFARCCLRGVKDATKPGGVPYREHRRTFLCGPVRETLQRLRAG